MMINTDRDNIATSSRLECIKRAQDFIDNIAGVCYFGNIAGRLDLDDPTWRILLKLNLRKHNRYFSQLVHNKREEIIANCQKCKSCLPKFNFPKDLTHHYLLSYF